MTTPRKRTAKSTEVAKVEEPTTDTLTTYTVVVDTDPSLLYPPIPASQTVGFGEPLPELTFEEPPKWKTYLVYTPIAFGALLIAFTIWALTL